jgi:O-antigen/teichoic acid export membrane protein
MSYVPPTKRNTTFKGDVLRLVSGTALAQIITLLAAPILTRLYAPEAFGVAAMFASITSILGVLACLRYELSIVLPDNDREAANLLAVSLVSTVFIACLTIPIIWYGGDRILAWVKMPELAPYLWLIPGVVLVHGIFTALNYWNTRTKHFMRLSIARVTSQLAGTGTSLGLGFAGHTTGGSLITASLGGQAVATAVLGGHIWRDNGRFILSSITWREMWVGMKRHRNFPLFSSWGALINTASWQIPVLMLGAFFSPVIVGFYSLGFRLIQMPLSLIGGAISQVFFQRGVEANSSGKLGNLVEGLFNRMLIIGLFPSMILMVIGADLFAFVFGQEWREAGVFTQILAPWALIWFLSSPLSTIYAIQEKQKNELLMHSAILITRIFAITIGGLHGSPRLAVTLFSMSGILAYGNLLHAIFAYSGLNSIVQLKRMSQKVAIGFVYLAPILAAKYLVHLPDYLIFILSAAAVIIYFYKNKHLVKQ